MKRGVCVIIGLFLFIIFFACKDYPRNKTFEGVSLSSIRKGEKLAEQYCQSCHLLPDPSLVDARNWDEGVLPNMGPRLGIFRYGYHQYPSEAKDPNLAQSVYPQTPVLSLEEWKHIIDYYTATSPDSLPQQDRPRPIQKELSQFAVELPDAIPSAPLVSFIKIDTALGERRIFLNDLNRQSAFLFSRDLYPVDSVRTDGCMVSGAWTGDKFLICNIGDINPNNSRLGKAEYLSLNGKLQKDPQPLLTGLARPVQIISVDLDRDGRMDQVVCEFGFITGSLSWYRLMEDGSSRRQVIHALPGAIQCYVRDHNRDGLPDLWVLFAQGEEGIYLFTNQGGGRLNREQLLRFQPSNGSTFFELADMNGDGVEDIIYTCGDNADYSRTPKPYHGVYIFLNKGGNRFEQKYFFPINGCYKALARDYDKDGDMDIAAISFFADYVRQPEESFVYLENRGGWEFYPFTFPESHLGRWLTMDAGDLDGDGATDLVLGNFSEGPPFLSSSLNWKSGPAFIFLKNRGSRQR